MFLLTPVSWARKKTSFVSGQLLGRIFKLGFFTIVPKLRHEIATNRCAITQKSAALTCFCWLIFPNGGALLFRSLRATCRNSWFCWFLLPDSLVPLLQFTDRLGSVDSFLFPERQALHLCWFRDKPTRQQQQLGPSLLAGSRVINHEQTLMKHRE
jgi:hypothetical protein